MNPNFPAWDCCPTSTQEENTRININFSSFFDRNKNDDITFIFIRFPRYFDRNKNEQKVYVYAVVSLPIEGYWKVIMSTSADYARRLITKKNSLDISNETTA